MVLLFIIDLFYQTLYGSPVTHYWKFILSNFIRFPTMTQTGSLHYNTQTGSLRYNTQTFIKLT